MASFIFYTSSKSGRSLCPTLYNNIALSYGLLINWLLLKLPKLLFERVNRKSRADPNGSTVARLLGLRVRIPPGAWLSVSCGCCLLSCREVSVLGWSLVRRSPTECGVCDHEASIMRPGPLGAAAAWRKKMKSREYGEMKKNKWMELTCQEHGLPFKGTVISMRHNEDDLAYLVRTLIWEVTSPRRVLLFSHNPTPSFKTEFSRDRCPSPAIALRAMRSGNHTEITTCCE